MTENEPGILRRDTGARIAYHHSPGVTPGVTFCTGFRSDMTGGKALALEAWCRERGRQFTRFDYQGHGASSGRFEEGTIGLWRDDALTVLDAVTEGPQVIVGSSMGGWMMLLIALARPERIAGLLGIAPAPDFTEHMRKTFLSAQQLANLDNSGYCEIDNQYDDGLPYRIGKALLDEGNNHCLLQNEIAIDVPVRLIHGLQDPDVPWQRSMDIMDRLHSADVEVQLIKSGLHRLSEPGDLQRLLATLDALIEAVG